jgi:pimeloyl-ACP methyl ester carboxylesterase
VIDRGFCRTGAGLIHYRSAGDPASPMLVMLHGGPGSSASLVPLITQLAATFRVLAPDTMGCGDSDPAPTAEPSIADYAVYLAGLLDALGAGPAAIYGHHTGAQIACELAIAAPQRVTRLILDGTALFAPALRAEFIERYAPPIVPVDRGEHLVWLWYFARDLTRYFPHYRKNDDHLTVLGEPLPADAATNIIAEATKAWRTWHLAYRAAFTHDLAARLPALTTPTLVLEVAGDPLAEYAERAAALVPQALCQAVVRSDRASAVARFATG